MVYQYPELNASEFNGIVELRYRLSPFQTFKDEEKLFDMKKVWDGEYKITYIKP